MPKALVIVESPAKAKTIGRFLGPGYRVEASFGHVRDLPESADQVPEEIKARPWARMAVDIEGDFTPYYVVPDDKRKQISLLKSALRDADELLLATDEDREGESISWHLLQVLAPAKSKKVRRIVFHEITEEAIREALANPREVDESLVRAQETRRIIDRLYGYTLSPVLWKKVQPGLSAGRVQSVAVRLIVEREEDRRAFRSSVYWDLEATFQAEGREFRAKLARLGGERLAEGRDFDATTGRLTGRGVRLLEEPAAVELVGALGRSTPWRVIKVEQKPAVQRPSPPFTTSTLQQESNRKLGFTARRTMQIAQRLYEGVDLGNGEREGVITYMRTDSTTLSERALRESAAVIRRMYGDDFYRGPRQYATRTRNAQEAHEAIRPTVVSRTPQQLAGVLEPEELRLYELIWKRTIASQMTDADLLRTVVEIEAAPAGGDAGVFVATGKAIRHAGFLRAYVEGSDDPASELGDQESILPRMEEGQRIFGVKEAARAAEANPVLLAGLAPKRHETTPPARYTEASLVKKLEEEGIGRPSTYATIMGTIQERGYVFKQGNALVPTFTAFGVIKLLRDHFTEYVDVGFTAKMEEVLDEISNGNRDWIDTIRGFYRTGEGTRPGLQVHIDRVESKIDFPAIEWGADPDSGLPLRVRLGRYGPYVQRGEGGEGHTASIPGEVAPADLSIEKAIALISARAEGPRSLGVDPRTGMKVYVSAGRFGAYVQLGESPEKGSDGPKPKRASLPRGVSEKEIDLAQALRLLELPREIGTFPDNNQPIIVSDGRYGPFVKAGDETRSLMPGDDPYTIGLDRAIELLRSPRQMRARASASKTVLKELGAHPTLGKPVQVLEGRYGPYVTDGTTNATVPKGTQPEALTLAEAVRLLEERAASGGGKGKPARGGKSSAKSAKAPARAAAKSAPKKAASAAKKPAATKKPAAKSRSSKGSKGA